MLVRSAIFTLSLLLIQHNSAVAESILQPDKDEDKRVYYSTPPPPCPPRCTETEYVLPPLPNTKDPETIKEIRDYLKLL